MGKKQSTSEQDPTNTLKLAEDAIRKRFGDKVFSWASKLTKNTRTVIPTGCLTLDHVLGTGGLETGRMVEVFGPSATGKTTLAMSVMSNALRVDPRGVLYIDAERGLNLPLAQVLHIDMDRLAVINSNTAEENIEVADTYLKTGEFSVCVVDSVAALVPALQFDAAVEDQFMGLHARFMSKICPRLKSVCNATNTTIIFINQIRYKIGSYGNPEVPTGGNSLPYYADIRIRVSGGESKSSRIEGPGGEIVGHKNTFDVVKNKFNTPFRTATTDLIYGVGYDSISELFTLGEDTGLINRQGAWYVYKDLKWQGQASVKKALLEDQALCSGLKTEIVEIIARK